MDPISAQANAMSKKPETIKQSPEAHSCVADGAVAAILELELPGQSHSPPKSSQIKPNQGKSR
jgi:hypothetical protein